MRIASRIMSYFPFPDKLAEEPFNGKWIGPLHHAGPERMTPLKEALCFKTNAALYSIYSATLIWAAARLEGKTDTRQLFYLAEALYAWQQDWRWFKRPAAIADLDDMDAADRSTATVLFLADLIHQDHIYENHMWSTEPMFATVAEAITLTRFNLPLTALPVFDGWMAALIARLDEIAPFDEQGNTPEVPEGDNPIRQAWTRHVMGTPLPPSVLDLNNPVAPSLFDSEWPVVLGELEWESNYYLRRPPTSMAARSSEAVP